MSKYIKMIRTSKSNNITNKILCTLLTALIGTTVHKHISFLKFIDEQEKREKLKIKILTEIINTIKNK